MNRFERDFNDTDPITYRRFITAEQMQPKSHPGHERTNMAHSPYALRDFTS